MDVEFQQKVYPSVSTALIRAIHEWLLILMLLIDAAFSYLVTRFARYTQLQIPCLICSRLDHVLGHERLGFYWDLICYKHKSNISSLLHCHHLHDNLVDELKQIKDASSFNVEHDPDPLSHVVYSKIKVTSDSESETRLSDDENACEIESPGDERLVSARPNHGHGGPLTHQHVVYAKVNVTSDDGESDNPISDDESACASIQKVESLNECVAAEFVEPVSKKLIQQNYESKEVADAKDMVEFEKGVPLEGEETCASKAPPRPPQTTTNPLNLTDAYKLAVDNKGQQLSGRLLEQQMSMKDSERASEDVKLLLSQISSRGIDISLHNMSPQVSANSDDLLLQRRISLERNGSNISLDESTISEIEGETVVDRLTRQVEHDRKIIGALYKELEEERNASAVAANQAMAMITRLQEEKAALYMEALQCLRMTEEQAEYEGEALQKANELLAHKEKEIQDLQAQLEWLKKKIYLEMVDRDNLAEEKGSNVSGFKELDYRETSQDNDRM